MKKLFLVLIIFFALKLFGASFDTADDEFARLQDRENERITKRNESYIPFETLPQRHEIWLSWDINKCRLMDVTPLVAGDLSKADLWRVRLMPLDEHGENDNRIKTKNLHAFLDEAKPMKDRSKAPALGCSIRVKKYI